MRSSTWIPGTAVIVATLLLVACSGSQSPAGRSVATPPTARESSGATSGQTTRAVPPYHESAAAAKPFPNLLPAAYFRNYPLVARAYQIASEIPEVIAQQPCYCYCDKFGHRSLLDCYASDHGAG